MLDFLLEGLEELLDSGFLDITGTAHILETLTNKVLNDFLKWIFLFFIWHSTIIIIRILLIGSFIRWHFFGELEVLAELCS